MPVNQGDIFIAEVDEVCTDHEKFFIVAALTTDRTSVATVVINSEINVNVFPTPELQALHHQIKQSNYPAFLKHDSFVDCSDIVPFDYTELDTFLIDYPNQRKGKINTTDRDKILSLLGSDNKIKPKVKRKYGI